MLIFPKTITHLLGRWGHPVYESVRLAYRPL